MDCFQNSRNMYLQLFQIQLSLGQLLFFSGIEFLGILEPFKVNLPLGALVFLPFRMDGDLSGLNDRIDPGGICRIVAAQGDALPARK